jgi:hypothetical protein
MPNERIIVKLHNEDEDGFVFDVSIEGREYEVLLTREYYQKLTGGDIGPEDLVLKSFEFLLEREPASSILPKFELSIISNYFPEYEEEISK